MPDELDKSMPRWLSIKKLAASISYRAVPSCVCAQKWLDQLKDGTMTLVEVRKVLGQYLVDFRHAHEAALELLIDNLDKQGTLDIEAIRERVTNQPVSLAKVPH